MSVLLCLADAPAVETTALGAFAAGLARALRGGSTDSMLLTTRQLRMVNPPDPSTGPAPALPEDVDAGQALAVSEVFGDARSCRSSA
ncbi:hypothetical protein AAGS40_29010 (plasmid) [Paraburkholderia sp. PREW-6R]|uniref:hypothetical protein n=1 Tax=Paraburkholderia sp. PREW-6R TaxID=3141544 RepID=UPI0031F4B7C5